MAPPVVELPPHVADVYVTAHALERLHEHHPNAGWKGALWILSRCTPLDRALVAQFLQRDPRACRDEYFLTPERNGIFVLAPGRGRETDRARSMVTYLRLSPWQVELATRLWGQAA